jgi:hypothetical protein
MKMNASMCPIVSSVCPSPHFNAQPSSSFEHVIILNSCVPVLLSFPSLLQQGIPRQFIENQVPVRQDKGKEIAGNHVPSH